MKNRNWMVALVAIGLWSFMPSGLARAEPYYYTCSTAASPYTWATVGVNSSQEVQAYCNAGDIALGGGYELESPPSPPGVLVTVTENSFYASGETAIGWQVVLQNTNLNPFCFFPKPNVKFCPSVNFRVCVSCVTPPV